MVKPSLPWLAMWLFTWRKALFQQVQGGHARQCEHRTHREESLSRQVTWHRNCADSLPTWCFQTNPACSSQYRRVLHQKEVCADLVNLCHILTYEGIFSHHCAMKLQMAGNQDSSNNNNYVMNHHLHSAYVLSSWPAPLLLRVTPTQAL